MLDFLVLCDTHNPPLSITCPLPVDIPMLNREHTYKDFKQANYETIKSSISNISWDTLFSKMSVDQAANYMQNILLDLINKHVTNKVFRKSNFPPWVPEKLRSLIIKKKKMAHKKYKRTCSQVDYYNFSNLKTQCKMASKISLKAHIQYTQTDLISNPAKFWSYMRNNGKGYNIPEEMRLGDKNAIGPQIPSIFASYFSSVYKTPNTKLNNLDTHTIEQYYHLPSNISFSLEDVSERINGINLRS